MLRTGLVPLNTIVRGSSKEGADMSRNLPVLRSFYPGTNITQICNILIRPVSAHDHRCGIDVTQRCEICCHGDPFSCIIRTVNATWRIVVRYLAYNVSTLYCSRCSENNLRILR